MDSVGRAAAAGQSRAGSHCTAASISGLEQQKLSCSYEV